MQKLQRAIRAQCLLAALAGLSGQAGAQEAKKAASDAFNACREQEKYGDAASCWRAWMDKHKPAADEAEVLYAEAKVKGAPAAKRSAATESDDGEGRRALEVEADRDASDKSAPAESGIGLSLIVHGTAVLFFLNEADQRFELSQGQAATYSVPSFGYGGGLSVGYALDKPLKWPNTHLRLGAERLVGEGDGTGATVTNVDLAFEKGLPIARRLKLYFAAGPSLTRAELKLVPPPVLVPNQTRDVQEIASTRFGGTARIGVELALGSRVGVRLEATVRVNTRGFYQPDEGDVIYWDFAQRRDSFSSGGGRFGVIAWF